MNKINLGKSRYGDIRELHELEVGKYSTEGFKKVGSIRIGGDPESKDGFEFIDFSGGPMLSVGAKLLGEEYISNIKFEDGRYVIYTNKFIQKESLEIK